MQGTVRSQIAGQVRVRRVAEQSTQTGLQEALNWEMNYRTLRHEDPEA